jgi:hypothetical protein
VKFLCALLLLLIAPAARADGLSTLHILSETQYRRVDSEIVGRPFHLHVQTPAGYADGAKRYPVVYVLDGGVLFPIFAPLQQLLEIDELAESVILVGISYGSGRTEDGNLRGTDFTAPSAERAEWGGAATFMQVLKQEITPLIESAYRVDEAERYLYGQSLGGQFALYAAMVEPGLFSGVIATNPALHRNLDFFLEDRPAPKKPVKIYIARGAQDFPDFKAPMDKWAAKWSASPPANVALMIESFDGEGHSSIAPNAFRSGVRWLSGQRPLQP